VSTPGSQRRSPHVVHLRRVVANDPHVPSPWFPTTSTASSTSSVWACCIPLPILRFIGFPPTPDHRFMVRVRDFPSDALPSRAFPTRKAAPASLQAVALMPFRAAFLAPTRARSTSRPCSVRASVVVNDRFRPPTPVALMGFPVSEASPTSSPIAPPAEAASCCHSPLSERPAFRRPFPCSVRRHPEGGHRARPMGRDWRREGLPAPRRPVNGRRATRGGQQAHGAFDGPLRSRRTSCPGQRHRAPRRRGTGPIAEAWRDQALRTLRPCPHLGDEDHRAPTTPKGRCRRQSA